MKTYKPSKISILSILLLVSYFVIGQELEASIFVTANTGTTDNSSILTQISDEAKTTDNSTLLILGNAVSKQGFSKESKTNVTSQLEAISSFRGNVIFTPGNNEWAKNGHKGVKNIEKFIQKNSDAHYYPNDSEPIKHSDIGEQVVLLTIDSQWFLQDWNKDTYINDDTSIQNRTLFFLEFENRIKKAQGKIVLAAIHHPIETNTKQGLLANTGGIGSQDFQNKQYKTLRNRLKTIARGTDHVLFVSGHDKNLQYLNNHIPQIISGAVGTTENVNKATEGNFVSDKNGYARLDIHTNGKLTVQFFTVENKTSKQVFTATVFNGDAHENTPDYTLKNTFPATQSASIYTKEATTKSGLYKALWGKHYREFYGKKVNAPVVLLDTLMGGLTPTKRGGGQQSKSLRLQDKDGKQFVMRALKKSTIKFLQANAFQETYIGNELEGTVIDKFLADFYTTSHPYVPYAIGRLSDAANVNYTNPILYYIPKQKVLGVYNEDFGDELYMIEEHVGDTQLDLKSFGKPKKILNTADVLQEINKSGKSVVDEPSYIRARIFDMLLGDWDRHEDQWRWALYKNEDGTEYCKPIPRDRDQAFSIYDGALISFLTRAIPGLRKMQTYGDDLRSVKWFASSPYHLDITLIHASDWIEWEKQAKFIEEGITDTVIEKAFDAIPQEIKGETIEDIKAKLKGRRSNIVKIARDYYEYLNTFEVITGTQKGDQFHITRLPGGKTTIKIDRKDLGILNRTFNKDITKEIWIYGLDGKDSFLVDGKGDNLIKIKIVGGKKNDTYDFKNTKNVKLYDYKTKENTIVNKSSKKWLVDDYNINNYDHRKVKHSFNQLLPIIATNPDDGLKIGLLSNHTFYGLQRNPFTYKHSINAAYYTSTSGYNLSYKGEFANIFHNWNFGIEGKYASPNFAENFFGIGNETKYDKDVNELDYNRARIRQWNAAISLNWRGRNGGHFQFKPLIESFKIENTEDRFIATLNSSSTVFENQTYGGLETSYSFENRNNGAFPTLGLDIELTAGFKTNIDNTNADNSFFYIKPELALDHKLTKSGSLVFATKIRGEVILGDDFEFYHAARIGGNNGLRGFRNERFTGKQSFFQNIDLRLPLGGLRTSVVPIKYGLTLGFDYGRVWLENDDSGLWHNSVGGSLWLVGAEAFTANIGYFNSSDGGRIVFTLGFGF